MNSALRKFNMLDLSNNFRIWIFGTSVKICHKISGITMQRCLLIVRHALSVYKWSKWSSCHSHFTSNPVFSLNTAVSQCSLCSWHGHVTLLHSFFMWPCAHANLICHLWVHKHTIIAFGLPTTLKAANQNWCLVTLLVGSWYYHTSSYSNNHSPLLLLYLVGHRQERILLCTLGCRISQTQLFLGSQFHTVVATMFRVLLFVQNCSYYKW